MKKIRTINPEESESIREKIIENYPYNPLNFIRRGNKRGFGEWFCEDIFPRETKNSYFNFIWKGNDGSEWAIVANLLSWDSMWFGKKIVKLELVIPLTEPFERPCFDFTTLLGDFILELKEKKIDYVFTNAPVNYNGLVQGLGEVGFSLVETRLTYWMEKLNNFSITKESPVRLAKPGDVEFLGRAASETVNPNDRFHADPFFQRDRVDALMKEWINASINKGFADTVLVPSLEGKSPGAVMTAKTHREQWGRIGVNLSQMVFSVVSPEFKGWYARLVGQTTLYLRDQGAEAVFLTTQAANRAVLRVWSKLGYQFGNASLVFRKILN